MISYYEFKEYMCKILGVQAQEGEVHGNEDITVTLQNRGYNDGAEQIEFTLYNEELQELYNRVQNMNYDRLGMYNHNSYEIAIDIEGPIRRREEFPIIANDEVNGINYEVNYPSTEYCVYLILKLKEFLNEMKRPMPRPFKIRRAMDIGRAWRNEGEITLATVLAQMVGEVTLKITTRGAVSLDKISQYRDSFYFEFMYRTELGVTEFQNIKSVFRVSTVNRRRDLSQMDTPPLRVYSSDVVDYYKLALSSNDPYINYISFYHVMEYYFDEVFKNKMVEDIKNKITHPDFSYKNDDKVYDIALFVKNRIRMNDEAGRGNELEELKYVLKEYIDIEELKARVNNMDAEATNYYQTSKVTFCNAPTIGWSDTQGFFTQLAKRIYYTRNSLVHSKSGKNNERYRPYKNEVELQREIPLVKAVAETIIINSSVII